MSSPARQLRNETNSISLNGVSWLIVALSLAGYVFIGYFLSRQNFLQYIPVYLLLFAGYIHLIKRNIHEAESRIRTFGSPDGLSAESTTLLLSRKSDLGILLAVSILFRLSFLFSIPTLSDDYFRFIWDGKMWTGGLNPYTIIPSVQMQLSNVHDSYLMQLYGGMNSPDYFTVYPPVCQFIFGLAASLFPDDLLGSVVVIRVFCIAADIGIIYLLQKMLSHFNLPKRNVLLYALNPLVIIELNGNVHFEAVMMFFLLLAVYLIIQYTHQIPSSGSGGQGITESLRSENEKVETTRRNRKFFLSAFAYGFSITSKLIPLMFLPFIIRRLKWKRSIGYFILIGLMTILLFLPFINKDLITQISTSIDLYFQKFEFNASIFYIIRWIGYEANGYDIIQKTGPWLALVTFILIVFLATKEKNSSWKNFFLSIQWALTIYLFFATTVHPWYITTLVMLSVITGYQYAIVWSLFIALTYVTYQMLPYQENLWFVGAEYLAVSGVLLYELYRHRNEPGGGSFQSDL